jgi:diguanylate cyclase (GGDEF)-like protein
MQVLERLVPHMPLRRLAVIVAAVWTGFNLGAFSWHLTQHEREIDILLREIGRATIGRDILYRQWNAGHGGVYAPVTRATPPNPYILPAIVPARDEVTLSGRQLTLINPAYMTRQIQELAVRQGGIGGRITSLNPINPLNQAAAWEIRALRTLAGGGTEYVEFAEVEGIRLLRMLLPLRMEKSCLKCHVRQGYKEGELAGGLSVVLPVEPYHRLANSSHRTIGTVHLVLWLAGLLGIFFGYRVMAPKEVARLAAERQILNLAYFDGLTGLVNRQLFEDRLRHSLALARRNDSQVGLLYVDLDRFKPVNDRYGHEAGDQVLVEAAERLKECVRGADTVARIGGDEFGVILEALVHRQEAILAARRINEAFARPFLVMGHECHVGASVGIGCYPEDGEEFETLLAKADKEMYRAKKEQRGRKARG